VLASPLDGDNVYVTFHQDQWQKTQDLENQVAALTDRVNQIKANQQESHRSTTAMGVDATENVTRLGNELERLKTRLSGMENNRSGREAEGIRTDVNALSEKVQAAEVARERMERLETRVAELNHGFDLAEIQNQEWRDNTMKDFAEIPKMTPYYRKLLQDGKDLGPVLQHLSDRQDGQEARNGNTEARVGQLVRTVDAGFTENKQQLGRIQAYIPKKSQLTVGHKNSKRNSRSKWKDSGRLNCFWGLDWRWGQWWELGLLDIS
jgi:DNA repair exonuclease SbcCD ATPase subunit